MLPATGAIRRLLKETANHEVYWIPRGQSEQKDVRAAFEKHHTLAGFAGVVADHDRGFVGIKIRKR